MQDIKQDIIDIYSKDRSILILIGVTFLLSVILLVFSAINLNPASSVVKIGYGDIGGYRDGVWTDMLVFPILACIYGLLHNFIALRVYHKRGGGMAKFFLIVTILLVLGTGLVLVRLLGEV